MAYTVTPLQTETGDDRAVWSFQVTETDATPTQEWAVPLANGTYTLQVYQAELTAGAGATLTPKLGKAAGWSDGSMDAIGVNDTTAGYINTQAPLKLQITNGALYGCSQVDTGTDNAITTVIVLTSGAY